MWDLGCGTWGAKIRGPQRLPRPLSHHKGTLLFYWQPLPRSLPPHLLGARRGGSLCLAQLPDPLHLGQVPPTPHTALTPGPGTGTLCNALQLCCVQDNLPHTSPEKASLPRKLLDPASLHPGQSPAAHPGNGHCDPALTTKATPDPHSTGMKCSQPLSVSALSLLPGHPAPPLHPRAQ